MLTSINPFTLSVISTYKEDTKQAIQDSIEKSSIAQICWKQLSISERANYMLKLSAYLLSNREDLAKIITAEMGKTFQEAKGEIMKCSELCTYYSEQAENYLKPDIIQVEGQLCQVSYEPLGVVLGIMPWNFPFWQVFRFSVAALMAGNTVLLKHASNCTGCALAIANSFKEAGFNENIFSVLLCSTDAIEDIIAHPKVAMVTLTGSEKAGSAVASVAGKNLKKSMLELGGSDAMIICEDANLKDAIQATLKSRYANTGQVCIAAKRLLVHENRVEEYINGMKQELYRIKLGDPSKANNDMGPMARLDLAEAIMAQYNQAVKEGAEVLVPMKQKQCLVSPGLIRVKDQNCTVFTEETFGPLGVILSFKTNLEAVRMANDSKYGLSASIWSSSPEESREIANELEVGSVFINELVRSDARFPIGGIKNSGYGRELGEAGIKEFCYPKTTYIK